MITNEMIIKIGETIANKIRCARIFNDNYKENNRENPYNSERRGIEQTLEIMGIDYEYEFDDNVEKEIVIKINGITIEI